MNNKEFVSKLIEVATKYKTLYVYGCFGFPLNATNKSRVLREYEYNSDPIRAKKIQSATDDTFGFDCVCLIKAILWGWKGDKTKSYGGAKYASNGVPDINADTMYSKCTSRSTNFSKIEVGEAVWVEGHIGVYIGDGLAVECTPNWENKVQITACNCNKKGYKSRYWTAHGKLPYITYVKEEKNSLKTDLAVLVKNGVISSPDYWETNAPKMKYVPELIHNMAEKLK